MMVTVKAFARDKDAWRVVKEVECSQKDAREYVKMFFDMGYDKVRVD